jgi:CubicO group peptidase (beta-lactamase class C family)
VALLGHALEEISGEQFDDLSRERVFDPLDMRDTSYHIANIDPDKLATPYHGASPATFQPHGQVGYPTLPDGMLRSSVPQLAKVLGLMASGGVYQGQRILAEATVAEMARRQIPELDGSQGLLWFYDPEVFGHDGSDPGTSAFMYLHPESGDGVLLVANGDWYAIDDDARAAYQLLRDLFDEAASL